MFLSSVSTDPKHKLKLVPQKVEKHFVVLFVWLELKLEYSQVISVWPQFFFHSVRVFWFCVVPSSVFGLWLVPPMCCQMLWRHPHFKPWPGINVCVLGLYIRSPCVHQAPPHLQTVLRGDRSWERLFYLSTKSQNKTNMRPGCRNTKWQH